MALGIRLKDLAVSEIVGLLCLPAHPPPAAELLQRKLQPMPEVALAILERSRGTTCGPRFTTTQVVFTSSEDVHRDFVFRVWALNLQPVTRLLRV